MGEREPKYVCVDCGTKFSKLGMHGHHCPDPGSMKRLKESIDACLDCRMHPEGDYCPTHYDMARKHPFAANPQERTPSHG